MRLVSSHTSRRVRWEVVAADVAALCLLAGPASAAPTAGKWSYRDGAGAAKKVVNVKSTSLDTFQKGRYRVRIYGQEFVRNKTDMARVYFDTRKRNAGPEFRLSWYLGRNPADPVGTVRFTKSDTWDDRGRSRSCAGIRKQVDYRKDVITLSIPRKCLGRPNQVRWAGLVMKVNSIEGSTIYGPWDFFPAKFRFKKQWVA